MSLACIDAEFVGLDARDPIAVIQATYGQLDSLDVLVEVGIDPGRDASGEPRRLDVERIAVDGQVLEPVRRLATGQIEFRTTMRVPPGAEPSTIVVTLPGIVGEATTTDVSVPVVRRAGPRDVRWDSAGEVMLPIHAPLPEEVRFPLWQIDFMETCGTRAALWFVGGQVLPPATVLVSRSLARLEGIEKVEACFEFRASISPVGGSSPWNTGINLRAQAIWTIRDTV